jgi:hypothetical protein
MGSNATTLRVYSKARQSEAVVDDRSGLSSAQARHRPRFPGSDVRTVLDLLRLL